MRPLAILLLVFCINPRVHAHAEGHPDEIYDVLIEWALALQNHDADRMQELLHPDFRSTAEIFPGDAQKLLNLLRDRMVTFNRVRVSHAVAVPGVGLIRLEPVIYHLHLFEQPRAFALTLAESGHRWRVIAVADSELVPVELASVLPEQQRLTAVTVRVRDLDSGAPVYSRVHVHDAAGEYWPPAGHMKYFPYGFNNAVGGDVIVDGKRYGYVGPEFMLPLAAGNYVLELAKGMEYEPLTTQIEVGPEPVPPIELAPRRWIDMNARGWYSGDTHVHFVTPQAGLLEARAEEVNVVNILAAKWSESFTNVADFTGAAGRESDPMHIVYVNEEARHPHLGHAVLLKLRELVYPMAWGRGGQSNERVIGGHDYPALAMIAAAARVQDALVSWAHFPNPGAEIAVDFALGVIDSVDLITWGDPLNPLPAARESAVAGWYRLLNAGFRVPVLGGTDKMFNHQTLGAVRSYVKVDGVFDYDRWIDGIRAGRTFVTSGPLLDLKVNGEFPGAVLDAKRGSTVAIQVAVDSALPVQVIEIMFNGKVVARKEIDDEQRQQVLTAELKLREPGWIAARAYSDRTFTHQSFPPMIQPLRHFAHTSPVYLHVAGQGVQSASARAELLQQVDEVIAWVENTASYADEAQRAEVLELFRRARKFYAP